MLNLLLKNLPFKFGRRFRKVFRLYSNDVNHIRDIYASVDGLLIPFIIADKSLDTTLRYTKDNWYDQFTKDCVYNLLKDYAKF